MKADMSGMSTANAVAVEELGADCRFRDVYRIRDEDAVELCRDRRLETSAEGPS